MKHSKVCIGVLNNNNVEKIKELQQLPESIIILLSNIDFTKVKHELLNIIMENRFVLLVSKKDLTVIKKWKKSKDHIIFVDWLLNQLNEINITMINDSLLFIHHNNHNWNEHYDGGRGFAVSSHSGGDETMFYGFSASLNNNSENLILKEFDGYCLRNITNN